MATLIVPILTFVAFMAIGGAFLIARTASQRRVDARLQEFGDLALRPAGLEEAARKPILPARLLAWVGRVAGPKTGLDQLRKRLMHAGFFSPAAPLVYAGVRTTVLAIGLLLAAAMVLPLELMFPLKVMIVVGCAFVASLIPSLYVDLRRNARAREIRHALPDAIDLLEICVSAGMGLDMAWNAVAEEIRPVSTTLADEMALTNLEIHLGADRATAMRHMADRTGSEEIRTLLATLSQSERFGTAVADALRIFAEAMREARQARAAESAEKLGLKMLFPMIVFILPAMLIVMGGAAMIKIITMFEAL